MAAGIPPRGRVTRGSKRWRVEQLIIAPQLLLFGLSTRHGKVSTFSMNYWTVPVGDWVQEFTGWDHAVGFLIFFSTH